MALIIARGVCVDFPIYGTPGRSLKNTVLRAATGGRVARDAGNRVVVNALAGVTFELRDGERVGLVGHNGSGKTTLLRVLAGAYEPVRGSVVVEGRVAAMLDMTLGIDAEATGHENILVRAAVMGYRPREMASLVEEICEFSELGDYIHMPVRTYSSGMAMRLAFAISTCVSADILLMDEWLSVGDAAFTDKAQRRLGDLVGRAKILVLASHDPSLIQRTCTRVLRLSHGQLIAEERVVPMSPRSQSSPQWPEGA